jgi:hypothetical protein
VRSVLAINPQGLASRRPARRRTDRGLSVIYPLTHAHSRRSENPNPKNKNGLKEKYLLGEFYVEGMKTKATEKQKRTARQKRDPFDCAGWRSFIMQNVRADKAAKARITATGETPH